MIKKYIYICVSLILLLNVKVLAANIGSTIINSSKIITAEGASGYTVTWDAPLADKGKFLGNTTSGSASNQGDKSISYIDATTNSEVYVSPFTANTIKVKKGTQLKLHIISGTNISSYFTTVGFRDNSNWVGTAQSNKDFNAIYKHLCASYTVDKDLQLQKLHEDYSTINGGTCYNWYVKILNI